MMGSSPLTSDPNDRIARIEAKVDNLQKWNRVILIVLILVLLLTALLYVP